MQCVHVSTKLIQVNYNTNTIQYRLHFTYHKYVAQLLEIKKFKYADVYGVD